ncbi:MAG: glycosyltransferase family 2 protein [Patescibacteria group bacterium]
MTYPKVSIIIVNFNKKQLTLDCLKSLSKITYPNFEVIVIDNNSQDESVSTISQKYPKVKQIINPTNLGYVGGNNVGINTANGDYFLILNNDTKVTPSFIEPLIKDFKKYPDLGIVQSKMLIMDKPTLLDNVASYLTSTGFLYHVGYLEKDKPEFKIYREIFAAKGACMLIRKEVLRLGAFDDEFWCYFEETDLCWRAWVMGYTVGFEPKSIIYHKMGATSSNLKSAFVHYHSFKNRIRTIIKNPTNSTLACMLPIHLAGCLALSFYFLVSGQIKGAGAIVRAVFWNLKNLDATLLLRSKVQKARRASDKEIFSVTLKNPSLSFYFRHLSLVKQNLSQSENQYDRKT